MNANVITPDLKAKLQERLNKHPICFARAHEAARKHPTREVEVCVKKLVELQEFLTSKGIEDKPLEDVLARTRTLLLHVQGRIIRIMVTPTLRSIKGPFQENMSKWFHILSDLEQRNITPKEAGEAASRIVFVIPKHLLAQDEQNTQINAVEMNVNHLSDDELLVELQLRNISHESRRRAASALKRALEVEMQYPVYDRPVYYAHEAAVKNPLKEAEVCLDKLHNLQELIKAEAALGGKVEELLPVLFTKIAHINGRVMRSIETPTFSKLTYGLEINLRVLWQLIFELKENRLTLADVANRSSKLKFTLTSLSPVQGNMITKINSVTPIRADQVLTQATLTTQTIKENVERKKESPTKAPATVDELTANIEAHPCREKDGIQNTNKTNQVKKQQAKQIDNKKTIVTEEPPKPEPQAEATEVKRTSNTVSGAVNEEPGSVGEENEKRTDSESVPEQTKKKFAPEKYVEVRSVSRSQEKKKMEKQPANDQTRSRSNSISLNGNYNNHSIERDTVSPKPTCYQYKDERSPVKNSRKNRHSFSENDERDNRDKRKRSKSPKKNKRRSRSAVKLSKRPSRKRRNKNELNQLQYRPPEKSPKKLVTERQNKKSPKKQPPKSSSHILASLYNKRRRSRTARRMKDRLKSRKTKTNLPIRRKKNKSSHGIRYKLINQLLIPYQRQSRLPIQRFALTPRPKENIAQNTIFKLVAPANKYRVLDRGKAMYITTSGFARGQIVLPTKMKSTTYPADIRNVAIRSLAISS